MAVNISIFCTHCRKEYRVPDTLVGKRVKCKDCGEVFVAPPPVAGPAGPGGIDLSALEQLEPAPLEPMRISAPPPLRTRPTAAPGFAAGTPVESAPLLYAPPIRSKRGRKAGPIDDLIHDKLPLLLILVGIVLPSVISFVVLVRFSPSALAILSYFVLLGGYVGITIPLTVVGLRIAAHLLDFELVESPGYRIVAAFAASAIMLFIYVLFNPPPRPLHATLGIAVASDVSWLFAGLAISLSASLGLVKLFFFLKPGQAVATWLIASVSYLIGNAITFALNVLILFLAAMIFSTGSAHSASSDSSGQAPPVAYQPPPHDLDKENATSDNLAKINQHMNQYFRATGKYPDALEALVTTQNMPAQTLHSPFGSGAGDDYAYAPYIVPGEPAIHDWVLVYDQAEDPIEGGAMILRGNGEVTFMDANILTFALSDGRNTAERLLAEKNANTPPPPPPAPVPPPAPPIEPSPAVTSKPPEPRNTGPAWAADVDAPTATPLINVHLRQVFNGSDDLYFSQNGGAWLVVNPQELPANASFRNPVNAELWNLKTLLRSGRYPAIHPMHDVILSADANYLVGRTLGGDPGVAVAFEVWSGRTGKLLQTLATPPIAGTAVPRPIGFPDADQLLTAGDELDVWNLKTGERLRQFADHIPFDARTLIAPSPNCKFAAVLAGDDSGVWLVSIATGKTLGQAEIDDKPASTGDGRAIQFSPDGHEIAALVGGQWIYVWSAANGKQVARFDVNKPVSGGGDASTLLWMPDGQGWLVGGDRIIDRQMGDCIYPLPPILEQGGQEFGQRRVIDNAHLVAQFRTTAGDKTALEAMPIDSSFVNTRAALRADQNAMKTAPQ